MLTIIRGLPGSGKSTYAKAHYPNALHLENDMYHYHNGVYDFCKAKQKKAVAWCLETAKNAMKQGMDVCVSNTFTRKAFVDTYVNIAKENKIPYEVIRLNTQFESIHSVPSAIFQSMKDGFEDYDDETVI